MEKFVRLARGLDVASARAALDRRPEYWMDVTGDASRYMPLLGAGNVRLLARELPEIWALVDAALAVAARDFGDAGVLSHARVGRFPPGSGLPLHRDGIDGASHRRYQLALQSEPGAEIIVDDAPLRMRPGELWQIDVSRLHKVVNASAADRITILFDTVAVRAAA